MLISCDTFPEEQGINTDHLPVLTELSLEVTTLEAEINPSFWNANWKDFRAELAKQLAKSPTLMNITSQAQLDARCEELTKILQEVICTEVHVPEITPKSKRWWNKELSQLRMCANKVGRITFNLRDFPEHQIHKEHKEAKSKYQNMLKHTKQQHWRQWLEKAEDLDLWAAHWITMLAPMDRGKVKIPKLKHRVDEEDITAATNSKKSTALAKCFFPAKLQEHELQARASYPKACKGVG